MKFDKPIRRLAPAVEAWPTQTEENTFKYVFSNEKVGRDGFIVQNRAIKHDNYDRNNVILFAHDDKQPVIGRGTNIDTSVPNCTLDITFVPREILPFAGTIRDLVAGKWMRAVSLSWQPIEYKRSTDPEVAAIFTEVDMLEVSIVPLPALPDALLDARSHGVDTAPLYEWAERLLDTGDMLMIPRGELETLRRAAKPAAAISLPAAPAEPTNVNNPAAIPDAGIRVNDDKERALKIKRAFVRSSAQPLFRGLDDVGHFCWVLQQLGYLHFSAAMEAEMEGDGSAVPGMIGDVLEDAAKALKAMADEELEEFLAGHAGPDDDGEEDEEMRALKPSARAYIAAGKTPRSRAFRRGFAIARAGKELSVTNQDQLEAAQDHHDRALKHHREMGERTVAAAEHLATAQERCTRATQTLAEFGEHVRAAKADPTKAKDHLDAAAKAAGETEKHMGAVAEAHDHVEDNHADAQDSHRACGRRIRGAQRCVRNVLSGAVTSDADDTGADDLEKKQAADAEKARAARAARAAALQPPKPPVTLTLD
jgi:hypothetical protein